MREWQVTAEQRWNLSPTPGVAPTLQQRWLRYYAEDWRDPEEEWRDVPAGYYPRDTSDLMPVYGSTPVEE